MELHFKNKDIRKLCEEQKVATRKLGADCARKLALRLSQLEAAAFATDLTEGKPHVLTGKWKGHMALSLTGGYRLVFAPKHPNTPLNADGGINWQAVTIISIEYIGDYHD